MAGGLGHMTETAARAVRPAGRRPCRPAAGRPLPANRSERRQIGRLCSAASVESTVSVTGQVPQRRVCPLGAVADGDSGEPTGGGAQDGADDRGRVETGRELCRTPTKRCR